MADQQNSNYQKVFESLKLEYQGLKIELSKKNDQKLQILPKSPNQSKKPLNLEKTVGMIQI